MYIVGGKETEELGVLVGCVGLVDVCISGLVLCEGRGYVLFIVKCLLSDLWG